MKPSPATPTRPAVRWLISFPENDPNGRESLTRACRGNSRLGKLVGYFLYAASMEAAATRHSDLAASGTVRIDRFAHTIASYLKVSEKSITTYTRQLAEWGFVTPHAYFHYYEVHVSAIREAVAHPPERERPKPRGRYARLSPGEKGDQDGTSTILSLQEDLATLREELRQANARIATLEARMERIVNLPSWMERMERMETLVIGTPTLPSSSVDLPSLPSATGSPQAPSSGESPSPLLQESFSITGDDDDVAPVTQPTIPATAPVGGTPPTTSYSHMELYVPTPGGEVDGLPENGCAQDARERHHRLPGEQEEAGGAAVSRVRYQFLRPAEGVLSPVMARVVTVAGAAPGGSGGQGASRLYEKPGEEAGDVEDTVQRVGRSAPDGEPSPRAEEAEPAMSEWQADAGGAPSKGKGSGRKHTPLYDPDAPFLCNWEVILHSIEVNRGYRWDKAWPHRIEVEKVKRWCQLYELQHYFIVMHHVKHPSGCPVHSWWAEGKVLPDGRTDERWRNFGIDQLLEHTPRILVELGLAEPIAPPPEAAELERQAVRQLEAMRTRAKGEAVPSSFSEEALSREGYRLVSGVDPSRYENVPYEVLCEYGILARIREEGEGRLGAGAIP